MSEVKGFALRGLLRYIKDSGYRGGIAEILSQLPPEHRKVFDRPINASAWYPYDTFIQLLRLMDTKLGSANLALCRRVGALSAERDLTGIFKILVTITSFETLVKRGTLVWGKYFSEGKFVIAENAPKVVKVQIHDFPTIDRGHCLLTEGWLEALARISGVKNMRVVQTKCRRDGDEVCEFTGTM